MTEDEIAQIMDGLEESYKDMLQELYMSFKYTETVDVNNHVYMYAVVREDIIDELCGHYITLGIKFEFTDMTKQVKFYDTDIFRKEERTAELVTMIHEYVENHLEVDDVLDKISELGPLQLTDLDRQILKNI